MRGVRRSRSSTRRRASSNTDGVLRSVVRRPLSAPALAVDNAARSVLGSPRHVHPSSARRRWPLVHEHGRVHAHGLQRRYKLLPPPTVLNEIVVGNVNSMSVSHVGCVSLSTPVSPLHLNNVLISPNLIKNLISVSVEFDPCGFSIKDLRTKTVLLRCDSSGELYPLRSPSTRSLGAPSALLAANNTSLWHARLGHPGDASLQQILHSFDLSCVKDDDHTCHACRLGKHVRLPFSTSNSISSIPSQLLHCDVWTYPIMSNFGFKYYLVILDDFSYFAWTFPLLSLTF